LGDVRPADFTIRNAASILAGQDVWARLLPDPQLLPAEIVAEGHAIPIARVAAMHEGKRRARGRREQDVPDRRWTRAALVRWPGGRYPPRPAPSCRRNELAMAAVSKGRVGARSAGSRADGTFVPWYLMSRRSSIVTEA